MLRVNFILCGSSLVAAHWQEVQVQAAYLTISVYVTQPPDVIVGTENFFLGVTDLTLGVTPGWTDFFLRVGIQVFLVASC